MDYWNCCQMDCFGCYTTDRAAPDQLTIPLNKLPWSICLGICNGDLNSKAVSFIYVILNTKIKSVQKMSDPRMNQDWNGTHNLSRKLSKLIWHVWSCVETNQELYSRRISSHLRKSLIYSTSLQWKKA